MHRIAGRRAYPGFATPSMPRRRAAPRPAPACQGRQDNHALATQFGLYDNFYDAGTNSAEGHNWLMQADNPDYTQSLAGQYDRSYDTEDDALGHQASGTLWSGAETAGKTVRDYGEFQQFLTKPAGASWQNLLLRHADHGLDRRVDGLPDDLVVADPVAEQRVRLALPQVRHQRPGHLPVRDLEAGLRQDAVPPASTCSGSPATTPAARQARPPRSPTTTLPSARSWRPSRTASTGRSRRSSWSRTTRRPAWTTLTATARPSRSSAPGLRTASSTTPTTPRST